MQNYNFKQETQLSQTDHVSAVYAICRGHLHV